jgi:hypothetical protein
MLEIRRYTAGDGTAWNSFVSESKNGTFLLNRGYMDYHSDRFEDLSLLVTDPSQRLIALFPASRHGDQVISHGGLTYGGIISDSQMTTPRMIELFATLRQHLAGIGVRSLLYKTVPMIYHRLPAEEDRYALFLHGASLIRRDILSVIDLTAPAPIQDRRARGARNAKKAGISIEASSRYDEFWQVLDENLATIHGRQPVHSVEEIKLLSGRFPEHIRLFVAKRSNQILGGTVIYVSAHTAHAQYIASSAEGRQLGVLDMLFVSLMERFRNLRYFDFGISNEADGKQLNRGLIEFKEGFGARAIVHDHYSLPVS